MVFLPRISWAYKLSKSDLTFWEHEHNCPRRHGTMKQSTREEWEPAPTLLEPAERGSKTVLPRSSPTGEPLVRIPKRHPPYAKHAATCSINGNNLNHTQDSHSWGVLESGGTKWVEGNCIAALCKECHCLCRSSQAQVWHNPADASNTTLYIFWDPPAPTFHLY